MRIFTDKFTFCDDGTCKYNQTGVCTRAEIHIVVTHGLREDGSRGPINACTDYEDRRVDDAGAD